MAKKIVLRFILPLLVFLLAAYSVFWFVKSGEIKKNVEAFLTSDSRSGVGRISSTGFPLSHKIEIEDISLRIDNKISNSTILLDKIVATSGVFSSNFIANIVGDIKIQSDDNRVNIIQFNQEPQIEFSVKGYKIATISYIDDGYKVLDNIKNTIFYAGDSKLSFQFSGENGTNNTKLKASFNNISSFDIFTVGEVIEIAPSNDKDVVSNKNLDDVPQPKEDNLPELPDVKPVKNDETVSTNKDSKITTNRNLNIDLEFNTKFDKENQKWVLQDFMIKNIELFSPLFKVNIDGRINSLIDFPDRNVDINIKVKNIDNILIYIRKFISSLIPSNFEIADPDLQPLQIPQDILEDEKEPKDNIVADSSSDVEDEKKKDILEQENQEAITKPTTEEIVVNLINDLAKNNPNSNDQISEFKIISTKGKMFSVNDVSGIEIMDRLMPVRSFFINLFMNKIEGTIPMEGGDLIIKDVLESQEDLPTEEIKDDAKKEDMSNKIKEETQDKEEDNKVITTAPENKVIETEDVKEKEVKEEEFKKEINKKESQDFATPRVTVPSVPQESEDITVPQASQEVKDLIVPPVPSLPVPVPSVSQEPKVESNP